MEEVSERQPPDVLTSDTKNETKIDSSEAPPGQGAKYQWFRAYNTGLWNGPKRENKEAMRRQDNLHRFDSLASTLELTDYQKERARRHFDQIDLKDTGKPIDHLIFAICVVVANQDGYGKRKRYWPVETKDDNDELFAGIADDLDIDIRQQLSAMMVVKHRTGL